MLISASAAFRFALDMLGELLAPSGCAACDARVRPRVLLCGPCAATVVRPTVRTGQRHGGYREHVAYAYGGAIATAITRFKYGRRGDLAPRLGGALASEVIASLGGEIDVVVPVPLHPQRLAERGFDQAALLAIHLARRVGAPWAPRALVRVRDTPKQASLNRAARVENVQGAFVCRVPRALRGARVLLVDDVRTTGSTLTACAAACREAGARTIHAVVLASSDLDEQ